MQLRKLSSPSALWDEYKGWVFIIGILWVLWHLRGLFSALGGAAANLGSAAQAATAGVGAASQSHVDQVKVQASTGTKTKYTAEQLAKFRSDAEALANMLGQGPLGLATLFKDQDGILHLLKAEYSRLNLYYNKPWYREMRNGKMVPHSQARETPQSVKNKVNYTVLVPFYKEYTSGRSLVADVRYFITNREYKALLAWIL